LSPSDEVEVKKNSFYYFLKTGQLHFELRT